MKSRMQFGLAIVLASLVPPLAVARPDYRDPAKMTYVSEPVASASKADGDDGALAKAVVDEMNADASLKGSKITVQPEEGKKLTLSGVTWTMDQAKKAEAIAAAKVGVENVTNAIRNSDM